MNEYFIRFSPRQRLEHVSVMTLFIVLSVTGLPQKFFTAGWAQFIIVALGGIDRVRFVHRVAGVLFVVLTGAHVLTAMGLVVTGRSALSMVPTRQDFEDAIATLKFYLGVSDEHPRFGRFDYRQKFEYWGLVFGAMVVIATGLVLLFPIYAAVYLPGEVIPAAKLAHGNEGFLAFLVVILWHIYNAHLNPDVFPFDTTIFTGKISRERMEHEHPMELEELERSKGARQP